MRKYLILSFLFLLPISSTAQENNYFLMLKNKKVNVRYGPSFDYPIKYIYRKIDLPVKVIDKKENFRRIIDHKKNSGWIHISQLRPSRSLITTNLKRFYLKTQQNTQNHLAKLDQGRLLKVIKCEEKWCNIKTGDYSGWIMKDNNIWGILIKVC